MVNEGPRAVRLEHVLVMQAAQSDLAYMDRIRRATCGYSRGKRCASVRCPRSCANSACGASWTEREIRALAMNQRCGSRTAGRPCDSMTEIRRQIECRRFAV